jgi:hypothetical protein
MVTQQQALDLFSYDPATGELHWRYSHNKAKAGAVVGAITPHGYRLTSIDKKRYYVHRLVWLIHHGQFPRLLDHINRNRSDNRIENLRAATQAQNMQNTRLQKNNTSGVKGISWSKSRRKFEVAYTDKQGRYRHVGRFPCLATAMIARAFAVIGEHGEFAT